MVGPDGKVAGVYRKSHIPDGPGYEEKFYFRPGNTGFKVWPGPHSSTLGVGVCWDQWYPETARAMMLMGADILFYPTAIGTEPHDPDLDTSRLWRRAMIGHAVSNVVPVVAANRIGTEDGQRFYGHSFICDERGDILAEFGAEETGVTGRDARPRRSQEAPRRLRLLPRPQARALWAAGRGRLMARRQAGKIISLQRVLVLHISAQDLRTTSKRNFGVSRTNRVSTCTYENGSLFLASTNSDYRSQRA